MALIRRNCSVAGSIREAILALSGMIVEEALWWLLGCEGAVQ